MKLIQELANIGLLFVKTYLCHHRW